MNVHQPMQDHLDELWTALSDLRSQFAEIRHWAESLHHAFEVGGKVMVLGNGGSAALASHLTGELVGRYISDRAPLPAIWLGADQAALTAIVNDDGSDAVLARQVEAFAAGDDVVVLLSTSGRSVNVRRAAEAAACKGAQVWSLTGPAPNPLASMSDRAIAVEGGAATVQEVHLVVVQLLCGAIDRCREPLVGLT